MKTFWIHANTAYDATIRVGANQGITAGYGQLITLSGIGKDGKANKELFLNEPTLLNANRKLEDYENDLKGLLLLEQDIKRIEFLSKITKQENVEEEN